ncbi:uncharacterized protein LOC132194495 [Neocloeon triangulifer]|uniref:uncharacterized protein LOC132194495 n=1 Tax=Neocloeon triangulifer TaxID=2078957 RepID=UPI00286EE32F|nr:uncharacterized protein LOC132194495 [Neocloeon triangulifer]XP_059471786.1 uncharacterized protein LOC132194495 [Neocloeon triangulifer]
MDEIYVSCIKINGKPILPPLLTDEQRKEMKNYRDLALQIELKIRDRKIEVNIDDRSVAEKSSFQQQQEPPASPTFTESTEMNLELDTSSEATFTPCPGSRLVRSESYTVETPSQALLNSVAESEVSETPTLTESRPKSLPKFTCVRKKSAKVATIFSPKKQKKTPMKKRVVQKEVESEDSENTVVEGDYMHNLIQSMKEEYELKLERLRQQQEEEKMRLREEFLKQQDEVFQKLNISSSPERPPSPPIKSEKSPFLVYSKNLNDLTNRMSQLPLAALVRGYFVRRLHKTERVQTIKAQIKETLCLAINMHEQPQPLSAADITLHGRLIQQLDQSLCELHSLFFDNGVTDMLKVIASDRERMRRGSLSSRSSSSGRKVSSATERRQEMRKRSQQENLTPKTGRDLLVLKEIRRRRAVRSADSTRSILTESSGFDGGNLRPAKQFVVPWR